MTNVLRLIKHSNHWVGVLFILCGAILFSIKAVLIKKVYAIGEADAVTLLTLRMVFSLPFYLFFLFQKKPKEPIKTNTWAVILILGLIGYYLSSILDFSGLLFVSASLERIILFTYPTFVVIINLLFFKQSLKKIILLALLMTYFGVALTFLFEDLETSNLLLGGGMILLASLTYAMYLVGTNRLIDKFGTLLFTSYTMTIATFGILVHFIITKPISSLMNLSMLTIAYAFFMAVFCTVIPSFMISEGIRRIGSTNAAIVASVGPISTILLAFLFLGESIHWFQLVGGLLVVAGVTIISLNSKK